MTVARKLLRVNLSDLAAKGAEPFGYLLSCFWSERCGWPEREAFAAGLAEDQSRFGVGPVGRRHRQDAGAGQLFPDRAGVGADRRGGVASGRAQVGDLVFVTGGDRRRTVGSQGREG